MTDPRDLDPMRYAAEALADAGIPVTVEQDPAYDQNPQALVDEVVQTLAQVAPAGWEELHGVFSMAGGAEIAQVVAMTAGGSIAVPVESSVIEPIRLHRRITAGSDGAWLRLMFECDSTGKLRAAFDYGDTELPPDQLLPGEAYLRDFQEYPRANVPLWLLAHIGNDGRQLRSAAQAHASTGLEDVQLADDDIPPLPLLWARIATLSAVCRGADAPVGPRADPSFQVHTAENGSCILARLPGDRAVLSGGRNDSRLLSAAYRGSIDWPDLYRGAPGWLYNLYLDPRAASGLLSFCYWWHDGHWYRAELPEAAALGQEEPPWLPTEEITRGMPGVWTTTSTADLVTRFLQRLDVEITDAEAPLRFVQAAEAGIASQKYLADLFPGGVPESFDEAEALAQLDATDVLLPDYPPIDQVTAIRLAVDQARVHGLTENGFPVDRLRAARIDGGWDVYVPQEPGEIVIDATIFLVADDRVVEATTMRNPHELFAGFAARFAGRVRGQRH